MIRIGLKDYVPGSTLYHMLYSMIGFLRQVGQVKMPKITFVTHLGGSCLSL